jgi:outer membrane protein assembly factor BamB
VDGEHIYVQSCRGELQCLNVADGKQLWHLNYVKDFGAMVTGERGPSIGASRHGYAGAPLIDGDHLIAAAGGMGASVICLNKLTGETLWKSGDDTAGYGSPVTATLGGVKQVVVFTAKSLAGFDASDGKVLWRVPLTTSAGRHAITPVMVDDTVVVSSYTLGSTGIRITKDGDTFNAVRVWTSKEAAINYANAVAVGNYVYGLGPVKSLFCLDAKTGQLAWIKESFFGALMRRDHAGFIVIQGKLLLLTDAGQGLLLEGNPQDPKGAKLLGQAQGCGDNWCTPAYANGSIFLRDNKSLFCVKLTP